MFFLPLVWGVVVVMAAVVCEVGIVAIGVWYRRRRRAQVGVQTLVGRTAEVLVALAPTGQVRVRGEIWQAHCAAGAGVGETVRVSGVDGLVLEVDREA